MEQKPKTKEDCDKKLIAIINDMKKDGFSNVDIFYVSKALHKKVKRIENYEKKLQKEKEGF